MIELKDIHGHIVELSCDQHGSRFLQRKLEMVDTAEREMVFAEIVGSVTMLVSDAFANYVVQKFFEFGSTQQRRAILARLQGRLLPLTLDLYGCRVMQKAFECCLADEQAEMIRELGPENLVQCSMNENGNHVIQKAIVSVDTAILDYIIQSFSGQVSPTITLCLPGVCCGALPSSFLPCYLSSPNSLFQVFTLATHTYGCRVIQRVLERCNTAQMAIVVTELHLSTSELVKVCIIASYRPNGSLSIYIYS